MSDRVEVSKEFYEAALTLSGAEYRLRGWYHCCDDEEEEQVYHLRHLSAIASETIREFVIKEGRI